MGLGLAGTAAAVIALRTWQARAAFKRGRTAPIREGRTTVVGVVELMGEAVVSPLSRQTCVAFDVEVFEAGAETPFARLSGCAPFRLHTADGTVEVMSEGGQVVLRSNRSELITDPALLWDVLEKVEADADQYEEAWAEESYFVAGQRLRVTGQARRAVEPTSAGASYRSRLSQYWVLEPDGDTLTLDVEHGDDEGVVKERPWHAPAGAIAWLERHGTTCPHCLQSSKRVRYVDDGISEPFLVCAACGRSFELTE